MPKWSLITSNIATTQSISVFVERNPMPLAWLPLCQRRPAAKCACPLKMAESSRVRAVVRTADGKLWRPARELGHP
ncbi:MAG: hypothetical protein IPL58_12375 [Betaproteobacteria bacterium]|uniref:Ig-like SoxY domain-containing protein n=1 Tax=Candidatus Proximibacter danicus TaxID=2954365 RepID=A0A9D7PR32_9PROT|nr:hypothetical protein [Candidatus Proximibacter danicus]